MSETATKNYVLRAPLHEIILNAAQRRLIILELKKCLHELDDLIAKKCHEYLSQSPDVQSMLYQTAKSYLRENSMRRPLHTSLQTLNVVLANPNFLREFYIILVIFIQFKDVVKKDIAPHTLEPVFRRYFGSPSFYSRFKTFMPNGKNIKTVHDFIQTEFSHFLISINA
jgi:hypothetical protein